MPAGFCTTRGSAMRKPETSVQFSYSSAPAGAGATSAPEMSLPSRAKRCARLPSGKAP